MRIPSRLRQSVIKEMLKDLFGFKAGDVAPLLKLYNALKKEFREEQEKRKMVGSLTALPLWYKTSKRRLVFMPGVLAEHLRENMDVFHCAEKYFLYDGGAYRPINDKTADNIVREKMIVTEAKLAQIHDAAGQWAMQIQKEIKELNPNPFLICVRNGVYDVFGGRMMQHDPKLMMTMQLPVSFVPDAQCPRFRQYLSEVQTPDQIILIQEIMGYLLIPVTKAQACFILVGEADAGKSLLIRVICEILLGEDNVSHISWQDFSERFRPAELFNKLCNAFADLPTKNIEDNGLFKAMTGEDKVTGERKNKDPFFFRNTARPLFSCNTLPRNYGDRSNGFYRRLILIRFLYAVPEDRRDPDLFEKLEAERDGIRLINNKWRFSISQSNKDELERYRLSNNSALAFIHDCCAVEPGAECSIADLRTQYETYCSKCGVGAFSSRKFNEDMELHYPQVQRGQDTTGNRRIWKGLRFVGQVD